jgi:DNA polymerase-4
LAWNRDERPVEPVRRVKSVGHEETFATDVTERATLQREVLRMSEKVASRLRRTECAARTVQLKVRYADFRTITRSRTLAEATDLAADIGLVAEDLLSKVDLSGGIRLLGVTAQQLEAADAVQAALPFDSPGEPADPARREQLGRVERSVDRVRERYGDAAVVPARLLDPRAANPGDRDREETPS